MTPNADKLRLLFVDDSSRRIHSALKKYGESHCVVIAPNVPEALRLLSDQDWDVVSLDFDLDGHDYCDTDSKTCAMEIVRYFSKTGWPHHKRMPRWVVHSSNSFGANMLLRELRLLFPENKADIVRMRYAYDEGEG